MKHKAQTIRFEGFKRFRSLENVAVVNIDQGDCRSFVHFEMTKNGSWRAISYIKNRLPLRESSENEKTVKIGFRPELEVVLSGLTEVDVSRKFICFDEMEDGTWRLSVTKSVHEEMF